VDESLLEIKKLLSELKKDVDSLGADSARLATMSAVGKLLGVAKEIGGNLNRLVSTSEQSKLVFGPDRKPLMITEDLVECILAPPQAVDPEGYDHATSTGDLDAFHEWRHKHRLLMDGMPVWQDGESVESHERQLAQWIRQQPGGLEVLPYQNEDDELHDRLIELAWADKAKHKNSDIVTQSALLAQAIIVGVSRSITPMLDEIKNTLVQIPGKIDNIAKAYSVGSLHEEAFKAMYDVLKETSTDGVPAPLQQQQQQQQQQTQQQSQENAVSEDDELQGRLDALNAQDTTAAMHQANVRLYTTSPGGTQTFNNGTTIHKASKEETDAAATPAVEPTAPAAPMAAMLVTKSAMDDYLEDWNISRDTEDIDSMVQRDKPHYDERLAWIGGELAVAYLQALSKWFGVSEPTMWHREPMKMFLDQVIAKTGSAHDLPVSDQDWYAILLRDSFNVARSSALETITFDMNKVFDPKNSMTVMQISEHLRQLLAASCQLASSSTSTLAETISDQFSAPPDRYKAENVNTKATGVSVLEEYTTLT
jgi:hypothetical protein